MDHVAEKVSSSQPEKKSSIEKEVENYLSLATAKSVLPLEVSLLLILDYINEAKHFINTGHFYSKIKFRFLSDP